MKSIFRLVYNLIPFKKDLFLILKLFKPGKNITRHLIFKGPIKINVSGTSQIRMYNMGHEIEQRLFWNGLDGWEKHSNRIWMELAKKSDVIFDIGANTGIYTLLAKAVNKNARIFAVEPVVRVYDILNRNIELNQFEHITPINKAVSNENGHADIHDVKDGVLYEATLEKGFIESREYLHDLQVVTNKVEVQTLTSIIEEYKLNKIDLIKIDVETHEPQVVEGIGKYLQAFKPILIIEILNDSVATRLSNFFDNKDYVFYNINEKTGYEKTGSLSPSSHYNFIICHREKEPILLSAIKNCL